MSSEKAEHGERGVGEETQKGRLEVEVWLERLDRKAGGCEDKAAVFLRLEMRSDSIFLWLVNCYHFERIFTSFGSWLSESHNMCSLH